MSGVSFDLHIHSCLSPCADDDMTPMNIAGMAHLNGLDMIALTDHNSAKNCPAMKAAAAHYGLSFIPGMELTTAEEIHILCLFPDVIRALEFDCYVHNRLIPVKNKPFIFGNQVIMGEDDVSTGEEELLLINATSIGLQGLPELAARWGGVVIPAHLDREANGLLAILGSFPPDFSPAGLEIVKNLPGDLPKGLKIIKNSDAHHLWEISQDVPPVGLVTADFGGLDAWLCGR